MDFLTNITLRRRARTQSDKSCSSDLKNSTLQSPDGSICSLPNISTDNERVEELMSQLKELNLQLSAAHEEVKMLSLENMSLKTELEELGKKFKTFKKITSECTPKRHKPALSTPRKLNLPKNNSTQKEPKMKSKISTATSDQTDKPKKNTANQRPKLCILSSDKHNDLLDIAENTSFSKMQKCLYRKHNCGLNDLLAGINNKLLNFTLNDYCIIMIGDVDFNRTNDYFEIIRRLRETLKDVQHTNIIICLPTYKCADHKSVFNWRVETFNNLLWLDVSTHKYAHILDSNLNLEYDTYTFNRRTGTITKYGMETIFNYLCIIVDEIHANRNLNSETGGTSPENNNTNSLFRVQLQI